MKLYFYKDGRINLTVSVREGRRIGPISLVDWNNPSAGPASATFIQDPHGNAGTVPPNSKYHRYEFASKKRQGQRALLGEVAPTFRGDQLVVEIPGPQFEPFRKVLTA